MYSIRVILGNKNNVLVKFRGYYLNLYTNFNIFTKIEEGRGIFGK